MATKTSFRVVIVGGSVAGLTLANMLQNNGIDFVVLEAYPDITPPVGASIGLIPHGLRILDQLGCYEDIAKLVSPLDHFHFRRNDGKLLAEHEGVAASFMERHGYPMLFLDRQMVLQVLYDHIEDKSKVLTVKRVVKIVQSEKGVVVSTQDGDQYSGDMVVGADGVHSVVRQEMWRIANDIHPGYIPASETTAMPCDYGCIFGISNPCEGVNPGSLHSVFREHSSYLVLGGLHGRVYWFYFFNIGERVYSPNIPRYTKEDEAKLIADRYEDPIMPGLKFGEICKKKISSTMTALPEYVFKKWHYGRITTIGDAVHKLEPISGHGGNAAIESAATLVNGLVKALDKSNGSLSEETISSFCAKVQNVRQARTEKLVEDAHVQQRIEAMETPLLKFLAQYILPLSETDDVLFNASKNIPQAEKLDMAPLPCRPRLIPFKDELGTDPKPRGIEGWFALLACFSLSAIGYWGMHIRLTDLQDQWMTTLKTGVFQGHADRLKHDYTGISMIDETCRLLVSAFLPGVAGWDAGHRMLQIYFLVSLFPLIAIWTIEACRKRNALSLISFTSLWSAVYQMMGIAVVAPLYYAAYLKVSAPDTYWWPLSREVPARYSKTILPALVLGYLLPTILMFLPLWDSTTLQGLIAFWQPAPIYVNVLLVVFSKLYDHTHLQSHETMKADAAKPADMDDLSNIYKFSFVLSAILHIGVVLTCTLSSDPELSLGHTFGFSANSFGNMTEGLRNLWLADFLVCFIASIAWCIFAVWDLKRAGRSHVEMYKASATIVLATVTLGPGAAMSACWYWREAAMAKTSVVRAAAAPAS